jgi:hypothetical protein
MTFEGTFEENRKPVVTSAPDCIVYLNGRTELPSGSDPTKKVNIQPLIKDVSVNIGVESPPGSADISMHIPRHYVDDFFRAGQPIITTMMEVQIYMKGHYKVGGQPRYYPTFWGVTQSVSESYSAGERTLSISAQDILYWWNIQRINVNPSARGADIAQIGEFNVQGNNYFTRKNPFSIMYTLARTSYGDSMNADIYPGSRQKRSEITEENLEKMMTYWSKKWGRIRHSLRMYGINGRVIQGSQIAELVDDRATEVKAGKATEASKSKGKQWKSLQAQGSIDVTDIAPFEQVPSKMPNLEVFTSEYSTKMDIANTVADSMGYEFFMDVTGELVFKPPFYNLDVIPNRPVSWIRDVDIINEDYNENPPEATMIEASGSLKRNMDIGGGEVTKPRATYIDYRLVQKYGWKPTNYSSTFYGSGNDGTGPFRMFYHMVDRLDKENVNVHGGSVTIPIRPELRAGYPVYIEGKDSYYYVESVSHSFNYGSQCTTSLDLKAKRSKFYAPFDSWAAATPNSDAELSEQTGSQPQPGETANPNVEPLNIWNRPIDSFSGFPEPDKNVNLVYQQISEEEKDELQEEGARSFEEEDDERETEKVQRNIINMRSSFAVRGEADSFVYQVDPNKDEPIERSETGERISGPLTTIEPKKVEENGETKYVASYPVSDERGYEVVGGYEYGRSVSVTRDGLKFNNNDTFTEVQRLLYMEPEDYDQTEETHTGSNFDVDPSKDKNLKINPNNYGRRLNELQPKKEWSPGQVSTTREIVQGKSREDFQDEQNQELQGSETQSDGNVQSAPVRVGIDVESSRRFSFNPQVAKWADNGAIDEARQKASETLGRDISEEEYSDRLILSIIQVESEGEANAHRGDSQFWGPMQIGESNAESLGRSNTDFAGTGPDDREAVVKSVRHFIEWQEQKVGPDNSTEELKAIAWKGGPGTLSRFNELRRRGASEQQIVNYLEEQWNTDMYLEEFRKSQDIWPQQYTGQQSLPENATINEEPVTANERPVSSDRPASGPGVEQRQDADLKSSFFAKKLEENLGNVPDSLPSDIRPPQDSDIIPIINNYLRDLYEEAFERESNEMYRARTGTMRFDQEDAQSVPMVFEEEDVQNIQEQDTMVFEEEDLGEDFGTNPEDNPMENVDALLDDDVLDENTLREAREEALQKATSGEQEFSIEERRERARQEALEEAPMENADEIFESDDDVLDENTLKKVRERALRRATSDRSDNSSDNE